MERFEEMAINTPVDPTVAAARIAEDIIHRFPSVKDRRAAGTHAHQAAELITSVPRTLSYQETAEMTRTQAKAIGFAAPIWKDTVKRYKKHYTEFTPTTGVNYLALDEKDEDLPWSDRYPIKMANLLAAQGQPMTESPDEYSWKDVIYLSHFSAQGDNCKIVEITNLIEDEWIEFLDTFNGSKEVHGIQGEANCACGWFRGNMRVEGTFNDFLSQLNS
jgi:hypothetical protein